MTRSLVVCLLVAACGPVASLPPIDAAPPPPDAPVVVPPDAAPVPDAEVPDADITPDVEALPDAEELPDASEVPDAEEPDAPPPDAGRPDAVPLDAGGPTPGGTVHCAKVMGGPGTDVVVGLEVASEGSIYATGSFTGTATFGRNEPGQAQLIADGALPDIFIARFDTACRLQWVRRAGGPGGDSGVAVSVAADDSVYVTGGFSQTATFAPGEPGAVTVMAAGQSDIFVAHYNRDGSLDWVRSAGGAEAESGAGIAAVTNGLFVTGSFRGTASFSGTQLTATGELGGGAFLVKYSAAGNVVWARQVGDGMTGGASATRVARVEEDAVITGNFRGAAVFGAGEVAATTLTSAMAPDNTPSTDAFFARYRSNGTLAWAKRAGGVGYDAGGDVAAAADGSILVTGSFGEANGTAAPATFGAGEATPVILTSDGGIADVFFARLAGADGKLVFAKRAGGPHHDVGYAVHAVGDGFIVAGTFGGPEDGGFAIFGAAEANRTTLVSRGGYDLFVALFAADGKLVWAREAGGATVYDQATSVAVAPNGDLLVAGRFGGMAFFDSTGVGPALGTTDGFITAYRP